MSNANETLADFIARNGPCSTEWCSRGGGHLGMCQDLAMPTPCAAFMDSIKAGENCPACGAPWEEHEGWAVDAMLNRNFTPYRRGGTA